MTGLDRVNLKEPDVTRINQFEWSDRVSEFDDYWFLIFVANDVATNQILKEQ
jgi:hypothetical protein